MPDVTEKSIIRNGIKKRLKDFLHSSIVLNPLNDYKLISSSFADGLCSTELYKQADIVLAYAAMSDEAPTVDIIMRCLLDGKKLALPRIKNNTMDFFFLDEGIALEAQLRKNSYGIAEPVDFLPPFIPEAFLQSAVKTKQNILVIVPALAFTTDGRRLGRGGGFYDRYLARLLPLYSTLLTVDQSASTKCEASVNVCGMCYSFQVLDTLPCEAHDVNMQCILTEKELAFCEVDTTTIK